MGYLDVSIKSIKDPKTGISARYLFVDDHYLFGSDGLLHAFSVVYWPDKFVRHLVLNPVNQSAHDWKSDLLQKVRNVIQPQQKSFGANLQAWSTGALAGLSFGGPMGAAAGAVVGFVFEDKINDVWNAFWTEILGPNAEPLQPSRYYDIETASLDPNFPCAIKLSDIHVNAHLASIPQG